MVLVKTTKDGEVTEVINSDNYVEIVNLLQTLTDELEDSGIFLIKRKFFKNSLCRVDEFATIENGWECGFMLADGWISNLTQIDPDKE